MEAFLAEMDAAGIALGVAMGRCVRSPGALASDVGGGSVSNDDVEALVERYPGRFAGFGSVDVRRVEASLEEVDGCAGRGFAGIAFDNPVDRKFKLRFRKVLS